MGEQFETGAYQWRNLENGKVYVGGAYRDFEARRKTHLGKLRKGKHHNRHFQRAWDAYGESCFVWEILERCPPDRPTVLECEQRWIDAKDACNPEVGYNISRSVTNPTVSHTEETRKKMSASKKGRKLTPEQIETLRQSRLGAKHSEKTKARWSEIRKGRRLSEEMKENLRRANLGRKQTPETLANMSAAAKKRYQDPEQRRLLSERVTKQHADRRRVRETTVELPPELQRERDEAARLRAEKTAKCRARKKELADARARLAGEVTPHIEQHFFSVPDHIHGCDLWRLNRLPFSND